jgi:hypothetical protein
MIKGCFHQGSGVGNQLFRYVATRVLATDKGYDFGMENPELFKGQSFMHLDLGKQGNTSKVFNEKKIVENGIDVRGYDPEINFVEDDTSIDGEFQDPRYFEHMLDEIREWLKVEPLDMPDDVCAIGFRGGEYFGIWDLFLTKDYWDDAIELMRKENPNMRFEVHTDDLELARKFFPTIDVIHDVGINWRAFRYAKYAIISNSSFYILPCLLNTDVKKVIAPRYWARRNIKVWALPSNYYKQFKYI